jgi:Rps23 Pro-64 3,4-dihydroxylase Tpa1-like proline 4-hydroxylase
MEVKDYIKIYDDTLPLSLLEIMIRWCNKVKFHDAQIINDGVRQATNKEIRNTQNIALVPGDQSLTNVHYGFLLGKTFIEGIKKYQQELKILEFQIKGINDIQILKYEPGGFYTWHIDHAGDIIPRTMSCILLLNNNYKGGHLTFRDPNGENEFSIEPKPGRLIIWPSNFLYPHTVKPVTEGTRYSVVAWAI